MDELTTTLSGPEEEEEEGRVWRRKNASAHGPGLGRTCAEGSDLAAHFASRRKTR